MPIVVIYLNKSVFFHKVSHQNESYWYTSFWMLEKCFECAQKIIDALDTSNLGLYFYIYPGTSEIFGSI